jgi:hypothetical protein
LSILRQALEFDLLDAPVEAAKSYEDALKSDDATKQLFLNLALLYFECCDAGYAAEHRIGQEFLQRASEGMFRVLEQSTIRFGRQAEVVFWRIYFKFILIGSDPEYDQCRELAKETIVPSFHLLTAPYGAQYVSRVEELLRRVAERSTFYERYIHSAGSSALAHFGGKRA